MNGSARQVVVVLGCRVRDGQPSAALRRRMIQARRVSERFPELPVIFSGGRRWEGTTESEAMANWWLDHGTKAPVLRENDSQTTFENVRFVTQLCARHDFESIHLVTCDFHMARAGRLFQKAQLPFEPHPAPSPDEPLFRWRMRLREWGASLLTVCEAKIK